MPIGDEVRRGECDGADIIAVDHRDQDGPDDQLDLERTQPPFVQQARNFNYGCVGHRFPPLGFLSVTRAFLSFAKPTALFWRRKAAFALGLAFQPTVERASQAGDNATAASVVSKRNVNVS